MVFGAETEYTTFTVVSSVFVRQRQTGNPCSGRGGPENVPFFFWRAKVIRTPFRRRPNFETRAAFSEGSLSKNPIFIEEFSEGLQTSKTKQRMTTRGDSSVQHFSRAFLSERLRAPKTISRQTRFDNWSLQGSDETLRKPVFLENEDSRPHFRTHRRPHYRTHESKNPAPLPKPTAYIYIYIIFSFFKSYVGFQGALAGKLHHNPSGPVPFVQIQSGNHSKMVFLVGVKIFRSPPPFPADIFAAPVPPPCLLGYLPPPPSTFNNKKTTPPPATCSDASSPFPAPEPKTKETECTKIAHRRSPAIFAADSGIARNSAVGIKLVPFNRRENRRSLAIFFAKEIAHLGALKIARFSGGAVKIAAATAENRAILVHSEKKNLNVCKVFLCICICYE